MTIRFGTGSTLTPASRTVIPASFFSSPDQLIPSFGGATLVSWENGFGDFHSSPREITPPRTAALECSASQKSPFTAAMHPVVRKHIE